ncbi:MAG: hypothetical protein WDO73_24430 [Ignavibacteriota bacterium]
MLSLAPRCGWTSVIRTMWEQVTLREPPWWFEPRMATAALLEVVGD